MAAPAPSWNTVRVFGTWHNLDGTMKPGKWTLTFPVRVVNTTNDAIIPAGTTSGSLQTSNTGAPSLDTQVPATDDPDNTPNGWQYRLDVTFTDNSTKETYFLDVPVAGPAIDLGTVVLSTTIPTSQDLIVRGVAGGLAEFNNTIQVVAHGSDPNVARPAGATVVAWCGDAEPVHATGYDFRIPQTG